MLISDLAREPAGQTFACNICIVGAGPAGLTLATELASTQYQVLVLESGGRSREEDFSAALNEIESTGAPRVMNQRMLRNRVLGGSSHSWSGRCIPLDAVDYEVRPWIPCSGWPISAQEMNPFLSRAAAYLGVNQRNYASPSEEEKHMVRRLGLIEGDDLKPVLWDFSSDDGVYADFVRFGPRFAALKAPNVRVLTHATLTHINTDEDGRTVRSLEVASPQGIRFTVTPEYTVLCGGGLENARMLLASSRTVPAGVGNARGMVGRFLMDHPRLTVGTFSPEGAPAVQEMLGLKHTTSGARVQCGFALSTEAQYRERLLNAVAWTTQHVAEDDVWLSMRKMTLAQTARQERLDAARRVFRGSNQILPGLWKRFARHNSLPRHYDKLALDVMVEQMPDADSRLRLSARRDALGVPLSEIYWKVSDVERRTVLRLAHAVNHSLQRAGLPTASMAEWVRRDRWEDAVFMDAAHPSGTTRMASRESEGVVDSNCRVFGVENLYIAGSSVFPTGGHANPTLMIVALALRLADTLRTVRKAAGVLDVKNSGRRRLSFALKSPRPQNLPATGLN